MAVLTPTHRLTLALLAAVFAGSLFAARGCTDPEGTRRRLVKEGYRPLEVGGRGWFQGHRGDWYVTRFRALTPRGDTVQGVVGRNFSGDDGQIRLDHSD